MADFNNWLVSAGLVDFGFTGNAMTWSNNRVGGANIRARLDRVLVNVQCQDFFPNMTVKHLPHGPSDHAPLLMVMEKLLNNPGRFIFQKMWTTHENFRNLILNAWNEDQIYDPNPLVRLFVKLKTTKIALCKWNKEVFEDIHISVSSAKEDLEQRQKEYDLDPSVDNKVKLNAANAYFRQVLLREEIFWNQKSRVEWIDSGDRNTTFYHAVTQSNRRNNFVSRL